MFNGWALSVGSRDPLTFTCATFPGCTLTGWPPLNWLVIDGKHLTKPPKDWHPLAQDEGAGTAYIEVMTSNTVC